MKVFHLSWTRFGGKVFLTGATLLGLTACRDSGALSPESVRVIANLIPSPNTMEVPAKIVVGQPFQVIVHTVGGVCSSEKPDGATVDQVGSVTRIVPYELVQIGDEPGAGQVQCMAISISLHTVNLVLTTPGPAVIRAVGRRDSVEVQVTVEP